VSETVESGGRLLAEGSFRRLRFDGSAADDAFVVAIESSNRLAIIPFSGEQGCDAGPARSFVESLDRGKSNTPLDVRIPFLVPATEDDPETLRFTNFACGLDDVSVPGGGLPLSRDFANEEGVIVQRAAEGELLIVNPWNDEKRVFGRDAAQIHRNDLAWFTDGAGGKRWMWSLEAGELTARDASLTVVFRAGSDVVSVNQSTSGAGGVMMSMLDGERTLFTVLASDPDSEVEIAQDVCGVQFNNGLHGREVLYYSPCGDRTLRVHELETDTVRTVRSGIDDYKVVDATETGPILLYLTDSTDSGIGTLWARWGENPPIRLGENANLRLSRLSGSGWARVVVDWDGNGGTMLVGNVDGKLKALADGVNYYTSAGLIAEFDGLNGTLYDLGAENDDTLEKVVENIAVNGIRSDTQKDRALFLRGFDGVAGQLILVEGGKVRPMSHDVRPSSYQFTALLPMVTLLADLDDASNTATLKLHSTERDTELTIAHGVAETVEVAWPTEGLLYSAPGGDPPGIYFARAL
jgi:hypothetical protein